MGLCGIVANEGEIQGLTDVFLPSTGIRINQRGEVATDDVVRKHRDGLCCGVYVCVLCVCAQGLNCSASLRPAAMNMERTDIQRYNISLNAAVKFSFSNF